jgi:hypothetical protein
MNDNREHYVASQAPDWRASKPGHDASMADSDLVTWPVLAALAFAVAIIVALSVAGWLP